MHQAQFTPFSLWPRLVGTLSEVGGVILAPRSTVVCVGRAIIDGIFLLLILKQSFLTDRQ